MNVGSYFLYSSGLGANIHTEDFPVDDSVIHPRRDSSPQLMYIIKVPPNSRSHAPTCFFFCFFFKPSGRQNSFSVRLKEANQQVLSKVFGLQGSERLLWRQKSHFTNGLLKRNNWSCNNRNGCFRQAELKAGRFAQNRAVTCCVDGNGFSTNWKSFSSQAKSKILLQRKKKSPHLHKSPEMFPPSVFINAVLMSSLVI